MALIRVLTGISGINFSWTRGQLVDLDDDEALLWADGERAELVDSDPPMQPVAAVPADPGSVDPEAPADPEQPPGDAFDPIEHISKEVLAYVATATEQEALRVLDAEAAGEDRAGISKQRARLLADARARDAEQTAAQAPAEVAADQSRGGGRGDVPETR